MSSFKRETSVSVSDLHTVSENIKRLAISIDGAPNTKKFQTEEMSNVNNFTLDLPINQQPITTIMSNTRDDFSNKYEILNEIGRGGFSKVYRCQERSTRIEYAVKVIDLRPLRLRERFNPKRIRREVDIMKRLNHPNIIQFIEVYETPNELMMVMEYCPGDELFDVILARRFFSEHDAKPLFYQIAKALHYLHCLNIIHRDIKPENVLVLHKPDPMTNLPIAKLLDFGLSKNAGGGSAAKTFVGTPCYLAPEVEYTSKGLGGTYGLPADCWSLGAVLYVMLVARFPEFGHTANGEVVLRLPPALWDDISSEAKDLIRKLMTVNPDQRYTVAQVLQHPWLGSYKLSDYDLRQLSLSYQHAVRGIEQQQKQLHDYDIEEKMIVQKQYHDENIEDYEPTTMVVRPADSVVTRPTTAELFPLAPLLHLQRSIASCFQDAHEAYREYPHISAQIRKAAALCRQQLTESTKMLRKVEQTANLVLNLFPDLELAVEEAEPQLATNFFNMVRCWVGELKELVKSTQDINKASLEQIQAIVEESAESLESRRARNDTLGLKLSETVRDILHQLKLQRDQEKDSNEQYHEEKLSTSGGDNITAEQLLDLFSALFGAFRSNNRVNENPLLLNSSVGSVESIEKAPSNAEMNQAVSVLYPSIASRIYGNDQEKMVITEAEDNSNVSKTSSLESIHTDGVRNTLNNTECQQYLTNTVKNHNQGDNYLTVSDGRLNEALHKLRQIDMILEQLSIFWANTEVVLDELTKKGQHVEQFIGFATKPRLMSRFKERLDGYKKFWEGVNIMCSDYISAVHMHGRTEGTEKPPMYEFLEVDFQSSMSEKSHMSEKSFMSPQQFDDHRSQSQSSNLSGSVPPFYADYSNNFSKNGTPERNARNFSVPPNVGVASVRRPRTGTDIDLGQRLYDDKK